MKRLFLFTLLGIATLCLERSNAANVIRQNAPTEKQKIETLIRYIEDLKGAVFVRNGSEHSPTEAAEHLRLKYSKAGSKVKTARDFINVCASRSSTSGKDYTIRTADGRERKSKDVLMERLNEIEK